MGANLGMKLGFRVNGQSWPWQPLLTHLLLWHEGEIIEQPCAGPVMEAPFALIKRHRLVTDTASAGTGANWAMAGSNPEPNSLPSLVLSPG